MNDENTIINGSGTVSSLGTCLATAPKNGGASLGAPPLPSGGSQGPPPQGATPSGDATVAAGHGRSRRGKIARLPAAIRRQLNERLEDGEPAKPLILWLHSLPEVQAVLAAQFAGQPITPNNLTRWKQGGFQDWLEDQRALEAAAAVFEQADDLKAMAQEDLADRMTLVLTAKMALELQRINRLPDGDKKSRLWRQLLGSLNLVRRGNLQGQRIQVEREKLGFRRERHQADRQAEFWQWIQTPAHRDRILGLLLTPEQNEHEMAQRNKERRRRAREIMGLPPDPIAVIPLNTA